MELIKLIIDFSTYNTITQEIPINAVISKNGCVKIRLFRKTSNQFQPQFQNGIQPSNRSTDYLRLKTKIENGILFNVKKKNNICFGKIVFL